MPNNYGIPDAGSTIASTPSFASAVTGLQAQGQTISTNGAGRPGRKLGPGDFVYDPSVGRARIKSDDGTLRDITREEANDPFVKQYLPGGLAAKELAAFHNQADTNKATTEATQYSRGIDGRKLGQADRELTIREDGNRLNYNASIHRTDTDAAVSRDSYASNERINAQRVNADIYRANLESDRLGDVNDLNYDKMALENYHFQQRHNLDRRNSQRAAILSSLTMIADGFRRV